MTSFTFVLGACDSMENSPSETVDTRSTQTKIESVISEYCKANNERTAEVIPDLLYPRLYNDSMNRKAVIEMFYNQLNATKKFEISNLEFDKEATLIADSLGIEVYCQKYHSEIEMVLHENTPINMFDLLSSEAQNSDSNVEINRENLTLKYADKRQLMVIKEEGKCYIVPDVFFGFLKLEHLNVSEILRNFATA